MQTFYVIELAVLGLAVGSFLNVVIARLPAGESIVRPRSHCPKCGHVLHWYENVPLFSWVALRGKCSACKQPISVRYVLVELLTGTLFLGALVRFGWTWELVSALTFITIVVPLIFIDAEHWVLPFELTLPGIAAGLLLQLPRGWPAVRDALIGAAVAFVLFRVMEAAGWVFMRKEALGAGDKFLLAVIGAFMGWKVLLGVILLSSLQGAVFGIIRIALTGRAAPELPEDTEEPKPPTEPGVENPPPTDPTPFSPSGVEGGAPTTSPIDPTPFSPSGVEGGATTSPIGVEGGAPATPPEPEDAEPTFTPDFTKPGLSFARRLVLVPWTLLLQPIPDDPPVEEGQEEEDEPDWVPGPTNMPFGPWIGLAGLEVLLLGPWISMHLGNGLAGAMLRLVFAT